MRTAAYIGEITLTDLKLGELPPYLRRMRVPPRDLNELWAFEVDFEYCGGIMLHTEARLEVQEPELQKEIMKTTLEADSDGAVNSEFLENIENYGHQIGASPLLASVLEDEEEAGWFDFLTHFPSLIICQIDHLICLQKTKCIVKDMLSWISSQYIVEL
jgi:hypothetical protein